MKNAITNLGVVLTLVMLTLASCEYDVIIPAEVDLPDTVSFSADILPIFEANCNASGCHITGGIAPDLTPDNAYNNLMLYNFVDTTLVPEETHFIQKLEGSMGPYILPPEVELILLWIEQNAPNN